MIGIAQLMVVLDTTVVNIALPSAQDALGFSDSDRQWVVTAYALAFGSLLLLGGRIADLFGRRRTFLIGLAGFAIASAVGGAAGSFEILVAARAVQGVFGALLAPAALSLLTTTFTDSKERAKAFGVYGAIAGSGAAVGLLLGGVLTEYLSWRWCMYVNLVFALAAFIGGWLLIRERPAPERARLDVPGVLLVSTGLFGVVYGFSHAETAGWSDALTVSMLAIGAALLVAFVAWQRRAANPVLPLRVVLDRNRGGSNIAMFTASMGMFALFLFLTYYLQGALGMSAVRSGLAFLPMTAAIMIAAQIGTQVLTSRVGPRYIVAPGMLLAALGMTLLTLLEPGSSYLVDVLPATVIFGFGVGLTFSSAMNGATAGVDPADAGSASATVNAGQQVGGSIGTALLNTIVASAVADYIASHPQAPSLALDATVHSFTVGFGWAALILAIGGFVTAAVLRGDVTAPDPDAAPTVHM